MPVISTCRALGFAALCLGAAVYHQTSLIRQQIDVRAGDDREQWRLEWRSQAEAGVHGRGSADVEIWRNLVGAPQIGRPTCPDDLNRRRG
jgi:hypothetical protein